MSRGGQSESAAAPAFGCATRWPVPRCDRSSYHGTTHAGKRLLHRFAYLRGDRRRLPYRCRGHSRGHWRGLSRRIVWRRPCRCAHWHHCRSFRPGGRPQSGPHRWRRCRSREHPMPDSLRLTPSIFITGAFLAWNPVSGRQSYVFETSKRRNPC